MADQAIILVSGGKMSRRYIERLAETVGGSMKRVYNAVDSLPRTLPKADLLFFMSSSISHKVQEQIRARVRGGTQIVPLDHHWSKAIKTLEERGLIVKSPETDARPFSSWPTMNQFMVHMLARCPSFGTPTLIGMRYHSEVLTPLSFTTSLQSALSSARRACKTLGLTWPASGLSTEPDLDVIGGICADLLKGLEAPTPNHGIQQKRDVVRAWALRIANTGKPMRGCSFKTTQGIPNLPQGWCVSDAQEARFLATEHHGLATRKEFGPDKYLRLLRESLEEHGIQQPPGSSARLSQTDKVGPMSREIFMKEMKSKLSGITLSDWAWLRQDPDVWPMRAGDRRVYAPTSGGLARSGRLRGYKDEELLSAAYDVLVHHPPPEEPSFTTKKMEAIQKIADWYAGGPFVLSEAERNRLLTAIPVDGLTLHDVREAMYLSACGGGVAIGKGSNWLGDLLEHFERPKTKKKEKPAAPSKEADPTEDELVGLVRRVRECLRSSGLETIHISANGKVTVEEIVIKKRSFELD